VKFGLIELLGKLQFFKGTKYIEVLPPASIPNSFSVRLFDALPAETRAIAIDSAGNLLLQALGGNGTVTSVALSVPSFLNVEGSPINTAGTLAVTLATQTANTIFAGPTNGAAAAPTFRALAFADISALVGTGASTIAAGNDSRFHAQNTDTGTNAASFQLDAGNSGVRIKNNAGVLEARNAADSGYADLVVNNLTVRGTPTTIMSEIVTIDDNIIVLNNNYTGSAPTENSGIEIERGTQTNASFIWDELNDRWVAGLAGSEAAIVRVFRQTFTNATLAAGVLSVTHNLGQQYSQVQVFDNVNKMIIPDEVTLSGVNACTIDLTSYGALTGNWQAVVMG
jgi:hypothetical protein